MQEDVHKSSFYLSSDDVIALLCTELFERLPDTEVVIPAKNSDKKVIQWTDDPFAQVINIKKTELKEKAKQFLCFFDSRSEAAFFANYMDNSYQEFLRRRGIFHVVKKM